MIASVDLYLCQVPGRSREQDMAEAVQLQRTGHSCSDCEQFRPGCVTYREIFLKGGISFQNRGEMHS